jgi:hypothetical protein
MTHLKIDHLNLEDFRDENEHGFFWHFDTPDRSLVLTIEDTAAPPSYFNVTLTVEKKGKTMSTLSEIVAKDDLQNSNIIVYFLSFVELHRQLQF